MTSEQSSDNEHKVGYKSPPLHTRFKKGQSGNPSGRKKKSVKPFGELVQEVANETTSVTLPNGVVKHMSLIEAVIYAAVYSGGKSATKSVAAAILMEKYYAPEAAAHDELVFRHGGKTFMRVFLTQEDIDAFEEVKKLMGKYDCVQDTDSSYGASP